MGYMVCSSPAFGMFGRNGSRRNLKVAYGLTDFCRGTNKITRQCVIYLSVDGDCVFLFAHVYLRVLWDNRSRS